MFGKDVLKHKMGKVVNIQIKIDPEDEKKTDNAPDVEDSQEPGVVKMNPNEQLSHNIGTGQHPAPMPGHEAQHGMPSPDQMQPGNVTDALISHTAGGNPAAPGKTLDTIAHERAIKKKGLKI